MESADNTSSGHAWAAQSQADNLSEEDAEKTQEVPAIRQRKYPSAPFVSSTTTAHEEQTAATDVDSEPTLILDKASISAGNRDTTSEDGGQGSIEEHGPRFDTPPSCMYPVVSGLLPINIKKRNLVGKRLPYI
ncbi:hypothetical protein KDH_69790 [Dictyobacter sp. S3.2.2.5]|uniref:Uncharacterized protein n=1 Tax=Dictyobacter halimunensis TaxID=3026934 RepID=A0ABQ6G2E1_9CHLR|nr:hypothetical protein KDH_69790 [Dictyobacter sp. S3.2.2.5]